MVNNINFDTLFFEDSQDRKIPKEKLREVAYHDGYDGGVCFLEKSLDLSVPDPKSESKFFQRLEKEKIVDYVIENPSDDGEKAFRIVAYEDDQDFVPALVVEVDKKLAEELQEEAYGISYKRYQSEQQEALEEELRKTPGERAKEWKKEQEVAQALSEIEKDSIEKEKIAMKLTGRIKLEEPF